MSRCFSSVCEKFHETCLCGKGQVFAKVENLCTEVGWLKNQQSHVSDSSGGELEAGVRQISSFEFWN
jgi:hypothetical protein